MELMAGAYPFGQSSENLAGVANPEGVQARMEQRVGKIKHLHIVQDKLEVLLQLTLYRTEVVGSGGC